MMAAGPAATVKAFLGRQDAGDFEGCLARSSRTMRAKGVDYVEIEAEFTLRDGKIAAVRSRPAPGSIEKIKKLSRGEREVRGGWRRSLGRSQEPAGTVHECAHRARSRAGQ